MIAEDDRSHHQQKLTRQNCFCGLTIAFVKVESDRIIRQKKIKRWRLEFFYARLVFDDQTANWILIGRVWSADATRRAISRKRCPDLSPSDKTLNEKFLWRKIATTCRVQCVFFSWTAYFSFLRPKKKSLKLLLGYFRSFSECADTKQFLNWVQVLMTKSLKVAGIEPWTFQSWADSNKQASPQAASNSDNLETRRRAKECICLQMTGQDWRTKCAKCTKLTAFTGLKDCGSSLLIHLLESSGSRNMILWLA